MTALDLIKQSLRMIGIIEGEGTPSGAEGSDSLACLNQMIGQWNIEGLIPFTKQNNTFNVVANTAVYTIGTGQTWAMDRPIKIELGYITSAGVDYEMKQITFDEYKAKPYKTNISTSIPSEFNYKSAYPYGTVSLWPVPNANLTATFITCTKISTLPLLTTTIALPEGYDSALKYNLALELAAEFQVEPSAVIVAKAMETKANIKRLNSREVEQVTFDSGIVNNFGMYDVLSDSYL